MESATATLANGTLFEDRYEIQGELGSGSFSRVYRARQLATGKSVALKLLSLREGSESSTGSEAARFHRDAAPSVRMACVFEVGVRIGSAGVQAPDLA